VATTSWPAAKGTCRCLDHNANHACITGQHGLSFNHRFCHEYLMCILMKSSSCRDKEDLRVISIAIVIQPFIWCSNNDIKNFKTKNSVIFLYFLKLKFSNIIKRKFKLVPPLHATCQNLVIFIMQSVVVSVFARQSSIIHTDSTRQYLHYLVASKNLNVEPNVASQEWQVLEYQHKLLQV